MINCAHEHAANHNHRPSGLADDIRKEAKRQRRTVSSLVAEALAESEKDRIRQRMIEGYREMADENERLAEDWLSVSLEHRLTKRARIELP